MSEKKITVAIDGFSSSGKSTMARRLAKTVGYRYIDSGAMYRAVTLFALRNAFIGADGSVDKQALIGALPLVNIDFAVTPEGQVTMLNGENVEAEIRRMEVSNAVSPVAAIPEVRHAMVAAQKAFGTDKGIVMDGRDIGTTVFPDAELKVFVDASAQTRALRRFNELREKGVNASYEEVLANITERDHIDMTRAESPLRRADDAVVLDNSTLSPQQQDALLLDLFNKVVWK